MLPKVAGIRLPRPQGWQAGHSQEQLQRGQDVLSKLVLMLRAPSVHMPPSGGSHMPWPGRGPERGDLSQATWCLAHLTPEPSPRALL